MASPRKSPRKNFQIQKDEIIARTEQTTLLSSLFGEPHQMTCPCIFASGPAATGKTLTVEKLLKQKRVPFAWVNCIECYSPRLIMETVLNQISKMEKNLEEDNISYVACCNTSDFVRNLRNVITETLNEKQTVYLVFDNAERLINMSVTLLAALIKLQEITQMNLCTILISEIVWDKFRNGIVYMEPYVVNFPAYSKSETIQIMCLDCPTYVSADIYLNYVSLVLSIFFDTTRNVQELRYVAVSNFEHYYKPIKEKEATVKDTGKLWRHVEPFLMKALNSVYLRETESLSAENNMNLEAPKKRLVFENRANTELPYYSKILLIAAYIASYNPAATDKKFFLKNHGSAFKKKKSRAKKEVNQHQKGPKQFPLSRMLGIFYSICERNSIVSSYLLSQISSLITLRLISSTGDNLLAAPKLKCLASFDLLIKISQSVCFDLVSHLCDFNH